jgi:putative transposase
VFLDATYCKARVGGRVVSRAVVIATGVTADGHREVLGVDVGDAETQEFWTEFLRSLRERGLAGVQLVISDAHRGLTGAINAVCAGAAWQRCRVHFMRNALAKVGKGQAEMVALAISRDLHPAHRPRCPRPRRDRRGDPRNPVPRRRGAAARRPRGHHCVR